VRLGKSEGAILQALADCQLRVYDLLQQCLKLSLEGIALLLQQLEAF